MTKRYLGVGLVLGSLLLGGPASGEIGTIDAVPAATLLLPYFEVDLSNPNGITTQFSINNASNLAVVAHVTLWTDESIPTISFDVYLTGYDVQTFNLRDVFNGILPRTADAGVDLGDTASPTDGISNKGPLSQDINLPGSSGPCGSASTLYPAFPTPALTPTLITHIRNSHTGLSSPVYGGCLATNYGDNIARGYVTVDTVTTCNQIFPSNWSAYAPFLANQNVLWGNVFYVNPGENYAQGDTLVHIEACSTCFTSGDHTFYGRYNGATAADAREPLPTTMAAVYAAGGGFNAGTDYIVWRETNAAAGAVIPVHSCTVGRFSWVPLSFFQVLIFDEAENVVDAEECWWGIPGCTPAVTIPNAASRVSVAQDLLPPFNFGWIHLNLQHPAINYPDPYAQMWVTTVESSDGRYSVGFPAIQLDNANQ